MLVRGRRVGAAPIRRWVALAAPVVTVQAVEGSFSFGVGTKAVWCFESRGLLYFWWFVIFNLSRDGPTCFLSILELMEQIQKSGNWSVPLLTHRCCSRFLLCTNNLWGSLETKVCSKEEAWNEAAQRATLRKPRKLRKPPTSNPSASRLHKSSASNHQEIKPSALHFANHGEHHKLPNPPVRAGKALLLEQAAGWFQVKRTLKPDGFEF